LRKKPNLPLHNKKIMQEV